MHWPFLAAQHVNSLCILDGSKKSERQLKGADALSLSFLEARAWHLTRTQPAPSPSWEPDAGGRDMKGRMVEMVHSARDKAEGDTNNRVQLRDNKWPCQDGRHPVNGGVKVSRWQVPTTTG